MLGCQWNPSHDNPMDPDFYRKPNVLNFLVQNLDRQPIPDANVRIDALGRFTKTDSLGIARFEDLPAGDSWITASRISGEMPLYALDSILITISLGTTINASINLDALPYFTSVVVNSQAIKPNDTDNAIVRLFLKTEVEDPDGPADVRDVLWRFKGLDGSQEMDGSLDFKQDSMYYSGIILSNAFPDSNIDIAMEGTFTFEAFDGQENSVTAVTSLNRIFHGRFQWDPIYDEQYALLEWTYDWNADFDDTQSFNYLLRIFKDDPDGSFQVYEKLLGSSGNAHQVHEIEEEFPGGRYTCFVWVIDRFGSFLRSNGALLVLNSTR